MIFRPLMYIFTCIGLSVLIMAVGYGLEAFAGIKVGGSELSAVVPMIAAMVEGQAYYNRSNNVPPKSAMWKAAFLMTILNLAVSGILIAILHLVTGLDIMLLVNELGASILGIILVVVMLLYILMSRLGYGLGVNTAAKAAGR